MIGNYYKRVWILAVGLVLILAVVWLYQADFSQNKNFVFGVTFSQKYAEELKLDWRKTLQALLNDLKIRQFRLVAYWDLLEPEPEQYNFSDLDWQINEVAQAGGQIILALGQRVPRWPECHWPGWVYRYNEAERKEKILALLEQVVKRYQKNKAIISWQVENEPWLKAFGQCPVPDNDFYKQEVALVRSLDNHPVSVTESGELSTWLRGGSQANWLGISVYRVTWNRWLGYFYYPLPPAHYYLKSQLIKFFTGSDKIYVSELQTEPWLGQPILNVSLADQYHSMDLDKFKNNVAYARKTGLSPIYLWGAEWWYWLKQQGDATIWNEAKKIWQP
ncbi:MAG: beta-galactosidase [Candidatus Komeilibacteria bacterium]|nr:beta-galactosidase [Candidatus Komeilibacteria bacterium]